MSKFVDGALGGGGRKRGRDDFDDGLGGGRYSDSDDDSESVDGFVDRRAAAEIDCAPTERAGDIQGDDLTHLSDKKRTVMRASDGTQMSELQFQKHARMQELVRAVALGEPLEGPERRAMVEAAGYEYDPAQDGPTRLMTMAALVDDSARTALRRVSGAFARALAADPQALTRVRIKHFDTDTAVDPNRAYGCIMYPWLVHSVNKYTLRLPGDERVYALSDQGAVILKHMREAMRMRTMLLELIADWLRMNEIAPAGPDTELDDATHARIESIIVRDSDSAVRGFNDHMDLIMGAVLEYGRELKGSKPSLAVGPKAAKARRTVH